MWPSPVRTKNLKMLQNMFSVFMCTCRHCTKTSRQMGTDCCGFWLFSHVCPIHMERGLKGESVSAGKSYSRCVMYLLHCFQESITRQLFHLNLIKNSEKGVINEKSINVKNFTISYMDVLYNAYQCEIQDKKRPVLDQDHSFLKNISLSTAGMEARVILFGFFWGKWGKADFPVWYSVLAFSPRWTWMSQHFLCKGKPL